VKIRSLEHLNAGLLNLVLFLLGSVMVMIAILLHVSSAAGAILISIGTSLVASAVVAYLSARYIERSRHTQDIIETWGLIGIFHTRSAMNARADITLEDLDHQLDLMGYGFTAFRQARGATVEEKVRKGLRVRILTVNPHSRCVLEREDSEGELRGATTKTIHDLEKWVEKLKSIAKNSQDVQIKFCDLAIQSYYRQDDFIYTGPYLHGKASQQTISFEYKVGSLGYKYWADHFEDLWNDPAFARDDYLQPAAQNDKIRPNGTVT
jgi:hypothetical protein